MISAGLAFSNKTTKTLDIGLAAASEARNNISQQRRQALIHILNLFTSKHQLHSNMLATPLTRTLRTLPRAVQVCARRSYAFNGQDQKEINTTKDISGKDVQNVSGTNELPMENPLSDKALSETKERAEELRTAQSPNRKSVWSRSQSPRELAMAGPRFEQTIMELQVGAFAKKSCHLASSGNV